MVKDINGVEYSYANKDELAFGTYFEDEIIVESEPEVEIIQLVPRMYAEKLPHDYVNKGLEPVIDSENKSWL